MSDPKPPLDILRRLARRLRGRRNALALTLRELAAQSGLSQRFLVSVEAGKANISVVRLDALARSLGTSAAVLLGGEAEDQASPSDSPHDRLVALLGLRGAGKTAIGKRAAQRLELPFIELDALVAGRAGMSLESIFSIHGADYYRRLEGEELERLLATPRRGILATGGGLVAHHASYERLKQGTVTVFLGASAEDHWNRVVAQGDARPMANRSDAMKEMRTLLRARRALYEQAEHHIDTTALGLERSVDAVVRLVRETLDQSTVAHHRAGSPNSSGTCP